MNGPKQESIQRISLCMTVVLEIDMGNCVCHWWGTPAPSSDRHLVCCCSSCKWFRQSFRSQQWHAVMPCCLENLKSFILRSSMVYWIDARPQDLTQTQKFIMDFERPVINCFQQVLGCHITIKGGFYHLTQSTQRKMQVLGLQDLYK